MLHVIGFIRDMLQARIVKYTESHAGFNLQYSCNTTKYLVLSSTVQYCSTLQYSIPIRW